jgi:hypothetical protein
MSPKRLVAAIAWCIGWTVAFGLQLRTDFSIVGAASCLVWIVGGSYYIATGGWHEVFAGLRWREARVALLYIAVAVGVFIAVVQLTPAGDAARAVKVVMLTVLLCPAVLFVPSLTGIRPLRPPKRDDSH